MTRLNNPINLSITGAVTDRDIVTVGTPPLPLNDNAVIPILMGISISVDEATNITINSGSAVLYDMKFSTTNRDHVVDVKRKGMPTHSMRVSIGGCSGSNVTKIVADVGFEYAGGAKAVGA